MYKKMSALDDYVLETSYHTPEESFAFTDRSFSTPIIDLNNGSYSNGQVSFNTAQISNGGKYHDIKNSVVLIPLTLTFTATPTAGGGGSTNNALNLLTMENAFCAGLKSGTTSLIHSMSARFSNNEVVSVQPFQNVIINDKVLRESCLDTERNWFQTMMYGKDSIESIVAGGAGSASGIGECNNRLYSAPASFLTSTTPYGASANKGRISRMQETALNDATLNTTFTASQRAISYRNYVVSRTASTTTIAVNAIIRMDFIHDIFKQFPLYKNGLWDLVLNLNCPCTVSGQITFSAGGAPSYSGNWTYSNIGGATCPISLSEVGVANAPAGILFTGATAGTIDVKASLQIGNAGYSNCRIYPSLVTMSPTVESKYLSSPVRNLKYMDNFVYTGLSNVLAGSAYSQQITASMSRLRKLTIFGFDAVTNATNYTYPGYQSPWSSQPNTNALGFCLKNFNVQVSGQYVYPQNLNADWEFFTMNSRPLASLNAGLDVALSSGLISQTDYTSGAYGTIVVPLDRKLESTDDTPKSVLISFTNSSPVALNLICVLTYEREFNVDVGSGVVVL